MGTTLLLLLLAMLATAGILGTLVVVFRDGYRPVPTIPRARRDEGGAIAGNADAIPGASVPFAADAPGKLSGGAAREPGGMRRAGATRTRAT